MDRRTFNARLLLSIGGLLLMLCDYGAPDLSAQDTLDIVKRAFEATKRNEELRRNYTYRERTEERKLNKQGEIKDVEAKTFDVTILYGEEYRRLIEKNDREITPSEEAKQKKKLDKAVGKLANESAKKREKRLAKKRKDEEELQRVLDEFVTAYDFRLAGEEELRGYSCYVVQAEPRPGYEPPFKEARFVGKVRGKLWISKDNFGLVRIEAESIRDVSFGLFLFKLEKGAQLELDQSFVDNEVWMLDRFQVLGSAKVLLLKRLRREFLTTWSDYRKFSAESTFTVEKIPVGGGELDP